MNEPTKEPIKYYAPSKEALGEFMRRFPEAGANITQYQIDFAGERGDPAVREAAIKFMMDAHWTWNEDGVFHFPHGIFDSNKVYAARIGRIGIDDQD
jgi:hypothetical protein